MLEVCDVVIRSLLRFWCSFSTKKWNKLLKKNSLICVCICSHWCKAKKTLLTNCKKKSIVNFQEMEQCVKISQTFSTLITRKLQMIINGLESISIFGISYCMKKKGSIYLINSTRSIMNRLKIFFKGKRLLVLPCISWTWMLKMMHSINKPTQKTQIGKKNLQL